MTDSASNVKISLPGYEEELEEEVETSNSDSEDEIDLEPTSYSLEGLSFEHHACFAHTLQLVIKDGMKKIGQINNVLERCSKLVAFVRKSTIATDLLEGENRLQADNVTRWNSQLIMIKSVLLYLKASFQCWKVLHHLLFMTGMSSRIFLRYSLRFKRQQILYKLAVFHLLDTLSLV